MKLHELPAYKPPKPAACFSVKQAEPVEEEEEETLDPDEALTEGCKIMRRSYRILCYLMKDENITNQLNKVEQEQLIDVCIELYQFIEVWDPENGNADQPQEGQEDPTATDIDYVDMCGI